MFTNNYDSSFSFWAFEERLTQENCFLFCKKYGLFNGFIFLTIKKFLLSYFPNFMVSIRGGGGGGGRTWYFIPKQNCFSHGEGEGSFKEFIHKQFFTRNEL